MLLLKGTLLGLLLSGNILRYGHRPYGGAGFVEYIGVVYFNPIKLAIRSPDADNGARGFSAVVQLVIKRYILFGIVRMNGFFFNQAVRDLMNDLADAKGLVGLIRL